MGKVKDSRHPSVTRLLLLAPLGRHDCADAGVLGTKQEIACSEVYNEGAPLSWVQGVSVRRE